jgi:hypothetical protein
MHRCCYCNRESLHLSNATGRSSDQVLRCLRHSERSGVHEGTGVKSKDAARRKSESVEVVIPF